MWEELVHFNSEIEAKEALRLLEAAHIQARLVSGNTAGQYPGLQIDVGVSLVVRSEDVERAEDVLDELGL